MLLAPFTRRNRTGLARLNNEMDELFNGFFNDMDGPFDYKTWPTLDIAEQDDALVVRAEVPGCKADDIDISVYGNMLTISGEKKETKENKDKSYYHTESVYGSFRREVTLPTDVDPAKVEATYKDGILTINLPKAAKSKAVKVQVKS